MPGTALRNAVLRALGTALRTAVPCTELRYVLEPDAIRAVQKYSTFRLMALSTWLGSDTEPLRKWLDNDSIEGIEPEHCSQRWWGKKMNLALASAFKSSLPLRDQARFALQSQAHAGQWMAPPAGSGPTHFYSPSEYRNLLRWWLGAPILPLAWAGTPCPFCTEPLDVFGDHLVACHKNGMTDRHNRVRDALHDMLRHRMAVLKEQGIPGSDTQERPADIYLPHFDAAGPLFIDCFVAHPLAPSRSRIPQRALQVVGQHESEKSARYQTLCERHGASFCPWGMSTWGGYGPKGGSLIFKLIRQLVGNLKGHKRSVQICRYRYDLGTSVMIGIAKQLTMGADLAGPPPIPTVNVAGEAGPPPHALIHNPVPFRVIERAPRADHPDAQSAMSDFLMGDGGNGPLPTTTAPSPPSNNRREPEEGSSDTPDAPPPGDEPGERGNLSPPMALDPN